jgi:hypothetical protein
VGKPPATPPNKVEKLLSQFFINHLYSHNATLPPFMGYLPGTDKKYTLSASPCYFQEVLYSLHNLSLAVKGEASGGVVWKPLGNTRPARSGIV